MNRQPEDIFSAVADEREDIVRLLLDRGADVNAVSDMGETALIIASSNGHENIVRLLLDRGADVNAVDSYHETALMVASRWTFQESYELVRLLLERGADVNMRSNIGETALMWAAIEGYENVVRLLLDRGADVNSVDNDGDTALSLAQQNGHENVVRLLIQHVPHSVQPRWSELCDDLSEAGIEELRDIIKENVTTQNYASVAEVFEVPNEFNTSTARHVRRFKNSLEQYTKPQLCARLAQYYYQCRDKIDAISLENWFEDYRRYGPVFVTADRNCYGVENLYQSTLRNPIDPLTRRELSPEELRNLRSRRERIRRS